MYKIEIQQVKNGWICTVLKQSESNLKSNPFESMMGNVMKEAVKSMDGEDKFKTMQENDEYTGTRVFLKYKDLVGFLSFITE